MDNKSVIVDSKNEKQIKRNGINFKINDNPKPNKELLETLKDGKRVGYSTINEMMDSILK